MFHKSNWLLDIHLILLSFQKVLLDQSPSLFWNSFLYVEILGSNPYSSLDLFIFLQATLSSISTRLWTCYCFLLATFTPRVGKNPDIFKKPSPVFFVVVVFLIYIHICPEEGVFRVFSVQEYF
jgi:hypothetical protein